MKRKIRLEHMGALSAATRPSMPCLCISCHYSAYATAHTPSSPSYPGPSFPSERISMASTSALAQLRRIVLVLITGVVPYLILPTSRAVWFMGAIWCALRMVDEPN
jgi:hypothetical protein